jgi:hypothetical protein
VGGRTQGLWGDSVEVLDVLILDCIKELVVHRGVTHHFGSLSVSYFLFEEKVTKENFRNHNARADSSNAPAVISVRRIKKRHRERQYRTEIKRALEAAYRTRR